MSNNNSLSSEGSALFDPAKQRRVKERLAKLRQKNQANQRIRAFRNLLKKKDGGAQISLSHEKMQALPPQLKDDPDEALLYIYWSVRYYDEHMFKVILSMTNNLQMAAADVQIIFKDPKSYFRLTSDNSYDRHKLN